ncbi:MAG: hypothetical protein KC488_10930, partial [Candidatus Cloacimonetes bacterium]|nr:hypothetical protein [Candidatus Cloacimonadota bacterium]
LAALDRGEPDEALIEEVRLLADAKVPFVAEDWEKDIHWVKAYIKREMARVIWGRDESRRVDSADDPVIVESLLLFDEAARIARLK